PSQGNSPEEAVKHLRDGIAAGAFHAGDRGVTIALEPLAGKDTDVVNTLDQAVGIVKEIHHPAIQSMFDFHNTADEREPLDALVKRHFGYIRHVHENEMDGRHAGTGSLDFGRVFEYLAGLKYSGLVYLEVLEYKNGTVRVIWDAMEDIVTV